MTFSATAVVRITFQQFTKWWNDHWATWLSGPLEVVKIILIAMVVRSVLLRVITKVVDRATTSSAHDRPGERRNHLLMREGGGLLLATERRRQRVSTMGSVLRSVVSFAIFMIAVVMLLEVVGLPVGPILATTSVVGVAVGFGAQNLVRDFLAGLFLIMEDQLGVGDVVDVGEDVKGTIEDVGLRITRIRDANGVVWYIRNGEIKRVANESQGWGSATVDVPMAYSEDLPRVQALIRETAEALAKDSEYADAILEPPEVAGVESITSDTVVIRVFVKTHPTKQFSVARELRARLKNTFDREGVRVSEGAAGQAPAPARAPLI